jgi:hypothetical protein
MCRQCAELRIAFDERDEAFARALRAHGRVHFGGDALELRECVALRRRASR